MTGDLMFTAPTGAKSSNLLSGGDRAVTSNKKACRLAAVGLLCGWLMQAGVAQEVPRLPEARDTTEPPITARLNFNEAPLDIVLADYSEKTGRTLLRAPGLPTPSFTLRSQGELTISEYLSAVETVLTMHGIGLVESGERFMRVVPIKSVRREPLDIMESLAEGAVPERTGTMVSQMVTLKHIDITEAIKAIDPLRFEHGQFNAFERTNSILITDSPANINRMLQVLRMIDQPIEAREEPNVIQIRFAKAGDVKRRLEEIIADSQKEQQQAAMAPRLRSAGSPGVETAPPGVIRPQSIRDRAAAAAAVTAPAPELIEEAERGIIRGKVQIVADDRTNLLIIITRRENMAFFERMVAVLDVETSPDVIVKVIRLDFATAEDIAGMLNDLIGATQKDDGRAATPLTSEGAAESRPLREIEAALRNRQQQERKSSVGELSKDNIKILSDKRTNSLIVMASKGDLETLTEIIRDMDKMLSQVLIEAVIIEVSLDDSIDTGVSWIQKSMTTYSQDSAGRRTPVMSFAGAGGGGGGVPLDAATLNDPAQLATSGLGYFFTLFDLNLNMVLRASASDSRSRVVSTPALLTTDNTEAKLTSTERIYVFEGTTFVGTSTDSRTARYRQEDVGLTLTVKPQINENHVVMMTIKQEISEPGDVTGSDTDNLTGQRISINRTIEASIAVKSGQTIVLGGAVRESSGRRRDKVPLLGDIPILGRLFSSVRRGSGRTETIVFITPYVLDTPDQVEQETRRRRDALNIGGMWKEGWSGSKLAEPVPVRRDFIPRHPTPAARNAAPVSREVPRETATWRTSDGKEARAGTNRAPDEVLVDGTVPASESRDIDEVDAFIREQQRKWDEVMRGRR